LRLQQSFVDVTFSAIWLIRQALTCLLFCWT
jgi:hypothetical protein